MVVTGVSDPGYSSGKPAPDAPSLAG